MIVTRSEFDSVLSLLSHPGEYGLDTETTGLRSFHQDELFSIIISDEKSAYYFNFNTLESGSIDEEFTLPREWIQKFSQIFSNKESTWFLSNAKFDLNMLAREGVYIEGQIHCTEALGRVERNDRLKYGLEALAKEIGLEKKDDVKEYVLKNKLWEWELIPGKQKRNKLLFYNKVPLRIIQPYAENDAVVVRSIGLKQKENFLEINKSSPSDKQSILNVVENEKIFTKTCFKIEQTGILIDRKYCEQAIDYEQDRLNKINSEFEKLTGLSFKDSEEILEKVFRASGEVIHYTEKGNAKFDSDVLKSYKNPVAKLVLDHRDSHKKVNSYYRNFIYFADSNDVIHPILKQEGATTGRISIVDPALQTLPDEEDEENVPFKIRRAFIPRPGFFFFMPDYNQMEYRMMLDYAKQMDVIAEVKNGKDIHDATAETINQMLGANITRSQAKTLNFGLLYGMGIDALAAALKTTVDNARKLKDAYFQALPFVKGFIRMVTNQAERNGYITNWFGRRSYFQDANFCYKGPNSLIQGGCSDVTKVAMNRIDAFLIGRKSRMIVQVHDEIGLEMHESEAHLCPEIVGIMENVYPYRRLQLTCSPEYSLKSWGDKMKGYL